MTLRVGRPSLRDIRVATGSAPGVLWHQERFGRRRNGVGYVDPLHRKALVLYIRPSATVLPGRDVDDDETGSRVRNRFAVAVEELEGKHPPRIERHLPEAA